MAQRCQRPPQDYECGFCGNQVGTERGWQTNNSPAALIAICPRCSRPTFFEEPSGRRFPAPPPGRPILNVPPGLDELFEEARLAAGAGAYTAAVMVCRKMLMNIAVREGADEGKTFAAYVDYLQDEGFFSPKAKAFVDYIRILGNEANHEIAPKRPEDALAAIEFVGALLRHNYELPANVPQQAP